MVNAAEFGHQMPRVHRERLKAELLGRVQLPTTLSRASRVQAGQFLVEVPAPDDRLVRVTLVGSGCRTTCGPTPSSCHAVVGSVAATIHSVLNAP